MGHITVDRLEQAWKDLNKAEHLATNEQEYGALERCEDALNKLHRAADGMGFDSWFANKANPIWDDMANYKLETNPGEEAMLELIENIRELTKETRDTVIPELHDRIDYEPTPTFRE